MKHLLVLPLLALMTFTVQGQLAGKRAGIGPQDTFCGQEIYFFNDSIAMLMYGCEERQGIAFAKYRVDLNGELCFVQIPNKEFNPVVRKYRCELPENDPNRPWENIVDLGFKTAGDTNAYLHGDLPWKLMRDTLLLSYGHDTERLLFRNLADLDLCVNFPRLDGLFKEDFCFHPDEFEGTGDRYVIEVIFTTSLLHYELFSLKRGFEELDLHYKNNTFYSLSEGKKEVIELEKAVW